jgi:hypothetical protein
MPSYFIIQLLKTKDKENILKTSGRRGTHITYSGGTTQRPKEFSLETLESRSKWHNICKVLKKRTEI